MKRFAIEHLPRSSATYEVTPLEYREARNWLLDSDVISLVRTTELIGAIAAGFGVALEQSDRSMALEPGDTAVLISLSFGVLLAWAQGNIVPIDEDWRCLLIHAENPPHGMGPAVRSISQELTSDPASRHG